MTLAFTAGVHRLGFSCIMSLYVFRKALTSSPLQDPAASVFTASLRSDRALGVVTISNVLPGSGWSLRSAAREMSVMRFAGRAEA